MVLGPLSPRRALGLALAATLAGGDAARGAADGRPLPLRYDVAASWSPASRTLTGTERIALRDAGPGTLPVVWLRLWPNDAIPGEAEGCAVRRSRVTVLAGAAATRNAVACSALGLRLSVPLDPGAETEIALRFAVHVPRVAAQFGRSAGVDLLGRALPVLAVRDAAGWHLDPDTALGDPAYSLAAEWRAAISVPAALAVASTGTELSDTVAPGSGRRVVVAATAHARDFGLAIGPLERRSATVDGVDVRVFATGSRAGAPAASALRNAVDAVRAYDRWYGGYGSPELDVVLAGLGDDSQELPEIVFSGPDRGTIAHEVAHQWFYGIVGDDQCREPWLDESFAAYSEEQLVPGSYACDPRRPLRGRRGGLARGLSYYEDRPGEYADVIYRGGSCALTALAGMLGRDRFLGLLRSEVAAYRYGVIHTADFVALLARTDPAVARRWTGLVGL